MFKNNQSKRARKILKLYSRLAELERNKEKNATRTHLICSRSSRQCGTLHASTLQERAWMFSRFVMRAHSRHPPAVFTVHTPSCFRNS